MSCMEYDKQGDVEEDHADDVHADDVAMEVVEHGQNGVHQERDDEGSQADLDTYTFGAVHILRNTNLGSRETPPFMEKSHIKLPFWLFEPFSNMKTS